MVTFLFVTVLAILVFLCFIGLHGVAGPKYRHSIECGTTAARHSSSASTLVTPDGGVKHELSA
jgi:hypothetical protein